MKEKSLCAYLEEKTLLTQLELFNGNKNMSGKNDELINQGFLIRRQEIGFDHDVDFFDYE